MRGALLLLVLLATPADAAPPSLSLPVDCVPGKTCFVQKYVDVDPGEGVADYRCGHMSSEGHKGTDFRVPPGARVDVLAPADGTVLRVRDGVPDQRFDAPIDVPSDRACGNGIVIDHGGGFTSQYCHLTPGSVAVRPGERVAKGDRLGVIGASGMAEFHHVHVQFMDGRNVVDPFTGAVMGEAACGAPGTPLWDEETDAALEAVGPTHVLTVGFHDGPVTIPMIEADAMGETLAAGAGAIVGYGLAIGLEEGDEQRIVVEGPGVSIDDTAPVAGDKAQSMRFAGRRTRGGLAPGDYTVRYEVRRDGVTVDVMEKTITVR
ncbi:M23 family metallopeptidase [Acuticoccus mangrovi]|uniref:M23 family metallopeptidase n=1 Tax=Acuticoccus mangrovi TaxID=2796142 RepID=A0A934IRH0_9HYPH|nr:M23 family metallopeptidase [Acuticoccus mangrovi]MBJ3777381.1 M23 family metallopeptidase [Acuticoccus mangrovi]